MCVCVCVCVCVCEMFWKERGLCSKQFIFIPNSKVHGFSFKVIPFSFTHWYAFKDCWKDFSGMLIGSVVKAFLIFSTPSKGLPLLIPLRTFEESTNHRHMPPTLLDRSWIQSYSVKPPPAPGVTFPLLTALFEPHVPLENMSIHHDAIFIHLLKDLKCLWQFLSWFIRF